MRPREDLLACNRFFRFFPKSSRNQAKTMSNLTWFQFSQVRKSTSECACFLTPPSASHLKRDFPPYPLLPYPAHVSYAYIARGIDQPGGAAISKTRSLSAAGHHVTLPGLPFVHAGVRWGRPRSTTGSAPGRNGPVGGMAEGGNQSFGHPGGVNGARGPPR